MAATVLCAGTMRPKPRSQPRSSSADPRSVGPRRVVRDVRDSIRDAFAGIGLVLFGVRFFLPAESAHLGDTLWIVQLWLLTAAVWWLLSLRHSGLALRPDAGDVAVWVLAGGQIVSALIVVGTEGQKRAALNMAWEWGGVAVAVTMLRQWLRTESGWQRLYALIAVAGIVLSGLGVWQFAVWYPEYRGMLQELMVLEQSEHEGVLRSDDLTRMEHLRTELGVIGSEQDPVARAVIRQRLLASTEPLGEFALANTLAGILATALLLVAGIALRSWGTRSGRWKLFAVTAGVLLIGFCLVLTKSRTAWVGLLVGLAAGGMLSRSWWLGGRRSVAKAGAALLVLVGLGVGAWVLGAVDSLVIAETPKSLRYRIEYWTGTWGVIRESPLWGVGGAGNFRQHYLGHKLAGSSEEILDPHNFVLDVWANGGVIGLAGLLMLGIWSLRRVRETFGQRNPEKGLDVVSAGPRDRDRMPRSVAVLGVISIGLTMLHRWVLEAGFDGQGMWLVMGWCIMAVMLPTCGVPTAAVLAAVTALLVHLLGAGGIGMPAVSILLLLLLLGPGVRDRRFREIVPAGDSVETEIPYPLRVAATVLLTAAGLLAPAIPVALARTYAAAAEAELAQRGDVVSAGRYYREAAEIDPLDPEPWHGMAQLDYGLSRLGGVPSEREFAEAIRKLNAAIERDPFAPKLQWQGAKWTLDQFAQTEDRDWLDAAVRYAERAVSGYPEHSGIRGTLAQAYSEAGRPDDAAREAEHALRLDGLNRDLGHYDRLLDDPTVAVLRELANGAGQEGPAP